MMSHAELDEAERARRGRPGRPRRPLCGAPCHASPARGARRVLRLRHPARRSDPRRLACELGVSTATAPTVAEAAARADPAPAAAGSRPSPTTRSSGSASGPGWPTVAGSSWRPPVATCSSSVPGPASTSRTTPRGSAGSCWPSPTGTWSAACSDGRRSWAAAPRSFARPVRRCPLPTPASTRSSRPWCSAPSRTRRRLSPRCAASCDPAERSSSSSTSARPGAARSLAGPAARRVGDLRRRLPLQPAHPGHPARRGLRALGLHRSKWRRMPPLVRPLASGQARA